MKVPLFVELCAGTAALSLRLHRAGARPPVSRMGNKAGYADAILEVLGLRPGSGAERYLWCEPDPGCRLLLNAYTDAEVMREAAAVLRSWKDEDPRALWERLRAQGEPQGVAEWVWLHGRSYNTKGPAAGFLPTESQAGTPVWNAHSPEYFAGCLAASPAVPASLAPAAIDPREVARWVAVASWSFRRGEPSSGFNAGVATDQPTTGTHHAGGALTVGDLAARLCDQPEQHGAVLAAAIDPPSIPPGTICYIDPPYVGTTGYGQDLPRSEVERLALAWAAAGASVVISEAVPIDLAGWHHVEITDTRKGQKRTFSRQQREWLTMNREPAWRPGVQPSLF